MAVRFYPVTRGSRLGGAAPVFGLSPDTEVGVNVVAYVIEGGVLEPSELPSVAGAFRSAISGLDLSHPVVLSGRVPLWGTGLMVSELVEAGAEVVATWEPRASAAVIVRHPSRGLLGKGLKLSGELADISLGARGAIATSLARLPRGVDLVHVEVKGDKMAEPSSLGHLEPPPAGGVVVLEGPMNTWLAAFLAAHYTASGVEALGSYDPRLRGAVVFYSRSRGPGVGELVAISEVELERARGRRARALAVGVVGDPNSGKSVFLHLLNTELRRMGLATVVQEADLTAPTQEWSLFSPEARRALKGLMNPAARLAWAVQSVEAAKSSGAVDIVLVDIGGGRPDLGTRVTEENREILSRVDGVVIVSRNDSGQVYAWLEELRRLNPGLRVYAVLESVLSGGSWVSDGVGVVSHLDRNLYASRAIPQPTLAVARAVAERIASNTYTAASDLDPAELEQALRGRLPERQRARA